MPAHSKSLRQGVLNIPKYSDEYGNQQFFSR
jgi:hypothetical protein